MKKVIIIYNSDAIYPSEAPFHPSEVYPEYPFKEFNSNQNIVYSMVREFLRLHGFDEANYGTSQWNPLGELISPGDTVLIKPNLVKHKNKLGYDARSVFTHGSVIRAVLDYVYIALNHCVC